MKKAIIFLLAATAFFTACNNNQLDDELLKVKEHEGSAKELADYYKDVIFASMQEVRAVADELESVCSQEDWPFPTYSKLLYDI